MNAAAALRPRRDVRERVIVTPEGLAIPVTIASRGTRAAALMLDLAIIGALMIATTLALISMAGGTAALMSEFGTQNGGAAGSALEFLLVVWLVAMFLFRNAYFLFFELGPRGATLGKRMTGIRIAARDGGRLTVEMVIARNLLRDIELFLPLVFLASAGDGGDMGAAGLAATAWFLIFALFPFFNRDRLRAGDVIAGSWVLETPRRRLEAAMSVRSSPEPGVSANETRQGFSDEELGVYGEFELQTLERVLRENRPEALARVHETIARKIGRDPAASEARPFLEAYYRQLRARLETNMRMGQRKPDKHS